MIEWIQARPIETILIAVVLGCALLVWLDNSGQPWKGGRR
jgi:hypothetical protein